MNIPPNVGCGDRGCEESFTRFTALLQPSSIKYATERASATFDICCWYHEPEAVIQFGEKFPQEFLRFIVKRFNEKYQSETVDIALDAHLSIVKPLTVGKEINKILDYRDTFLYLLFWQVVYMGRIDRAYTTKALLFEPKGPLIN